MRIRLLACLTVIAVAGGIALYAIDVRPAPTRHAVHVPYTTTEVIEFLALSRGPVVADHPSLANPAARTATKLSAAQLQRAVESMTGCINRIDASAAPALTAAFNAADPRRLDGALRRFDAAAHKWLSSPYKQQEPCPPPPPPPSAPADPGSGWADVNGYIENDFVFAMYDTLDGVATLALGGALLAALLVYFLVGVFIAWVLVPAFIWYEFEATPTDLDRQTQIAKIVQALRS